MSSQLKNPKSSPLLCSEINEITYTNTLRGFADEKTITTSLELLELLTSMNQQDDIAIIALNVTWVARLEHSNL